HHHLPARLHRQQDEPRRTTPPGTTKSRSRPRLSTDATRRPGATRAARRRRGHRCARRGPRRTPGRTADPVVGVRADRPHGRVRRGADHPRSRRLVTPALQNRGPLHTRCATGLVRAAMHMPPGCTCTCRTACRPCTCTPGLHATCTPPCTIPTCMWYVAHTRSGN